MENSIAIMGVPFDHVTVNSAIQRIEAMIASGRPHCLVTANVDFLVQARDDVELRRILWAADMVLCDGTPVLWVSRLLGNPLPERVAGADLVPELIRVAEDKGYKVFLLGGTPESTLGALERVRQKHPRIQIEAYSPPFNRLLEMDHDEILARIKTAKPDLLFVSFGCPKQEKWIEMHYRDLGVPVAVGVGATVDFLAEQMKRAPVWMRKSGTEWIYRLLQEPRRLAKRYSKDLWVFGTTFLTQYAMERIALKNNPRVADESFVLAGSWKWARLPELCVAGEAAHFEVPALLRGENLILNAAGVRKLDATGVARLLRLRRAMRETGSKMLLFAPSTAVERGLRFARAWELFDVARDNASAGTWLQAREQESESEGVRHQSMRSGYRLIWQGEITAANAEKFWSATATILRKRSEMGGSGGIVALDLEKVPFLDSTGLGVLIRLRKALIRENAELCIENLQPAVLNVIRLAQLESLLLAPSHRKPSPRTDSVPLHPAHIGNAA